MEGATGFIKVDGKNDITVCYNKTLTSRDGLWQAQNPLFSTLPILVFQLVVIMLFNRLLMLALRPLFQPRIVANILGGVLLGPSFIGSTYIATSYFVPFQSMVFLETLANLGLVYYMFLVGLEFDFKLVIHAGRRALSIALAGIFVAVHVGWGLHLFLMYKNFAKETKNKGPVTEDPIFWGIALATTNFPDLARILADLKLLQSEVGRIALSAAVISDMCSWCLLLVTVSVISQSQKYLVWATLAFIVLCVFVARPALSRIIHYAEKKNSSYNTHQLHLSFVLAGVLLCAIVTDLCGAHSFVGPFVLGAIFPKGELRDLILDKAGNFVTGIMMPLFYLIIGLRTNLNWILNVAKGKIFQEQTGTDPLRVVVVVILAFATKIASTFVVALMNKMSRRDSLALGVLMNTKGLYALIVLNTARDMKALDNQTFAVMMVAIWIMTVPVGPYIALIYKPGSKKRPMQYKHKNIRSLGPDTPLRIMACTHTSRNVTGMINLLEASNPTQKSPIRVFAVHLVELTGHASSMLIVHDACKSTISSTNEESQSKLTSNSFENYARKRDNVSVQELTAVSPYTTMHEDICSLAEENCVNIIIVPFHKKTSIDGAIEDSNPSFRGLNKNVVQKAPCSVGVFVDRGLAASKMVESKNGSEKSHHFAMLFFGGADDREALAYAWRMASHPKISLTVVRFILPSKQHDHDNDGNDSDNKGFLEAMGSNGRQKQLDNLYLDEFKRRSMNDHAIRILEKMVNSWKEMYNLISAMEGEFDMYIVGRRHGSSQATLRTLLDCEGEFNELGPVGDSLVSSNFTVHTSVLIVHDGAPANELEREESVANPGE